MQDFFQKQTPSLPFPPEKELFLKLLPLTPEDRTFYKDLKIKFKEEINLDKPDLSNELHEFLESETRDVEILLRLAEHYEEVDRLCHKMNETYWSEKWAIAGRYPTFCKAEADPTLTYYYLKPQLGISNFDLLRGMFFYDKAIVAHNNEDQDSEFAFLNKAANCRSYHAVRTLTQLNYKKLRKMPGLTHKQLNEMIIPILWIIIPHGTPAFLLAAFMYFFIAKYHQKRGNQEELVDLCRRYVLQYLYAATSCMEQSAHAIDNAYNGSRIAQFPGKWSINIDEISKLTENLREQYNMNTDVAKFLMEQGKKTAAEFTMHVAAEAHLSEECTQDLTKNTPSLN
jgi:hypothetical protein